MTLWEEYLGKGQKMSYLFEGRFGEDARVREVVDL